MVAMQHAVRFVKSETLCGKPWVLARDGDDVVLFLGEEQITPETLEMAWAAYRRLRASLPRQRVSA